MSGEQFILYALAAAVLLLYGRRMYLRMSINQYTPTSLAKRIDEGNVILLDVRTSQERSASSIKGSLHIPINDLVRDREKLEKHKSKEIVCYCQTGSRSLVAAARLKRYGFTVGNLKGGMAEWNFFYR